jgi:hypothetical protein
MEKIARPQINLLDHLVVVTIVCLVALMGNQLGARINLLTALPGMIILLGMVMAGLLVTKIAPFYLPSVAWIALISTILTLPWLPTSAPIIEQVQHVNVLSLATPVLAYAGLAITKRELDVYKASGWKIIVVALLVFFATFVGSALIAEMILKAQGLI